MPTTEELFLRFGVAIGIGFLIGLQREHATVRLDRSIIAGERTTSLLSLGGAVAAMVADIYDSPGLLIAFLAMTTTITALGYFTESWQRERIGMTSEVAILISMLLGVLCYHGELTLAAALGIATTVILSLKVQTDRFVKKLSRQELYAALQLAVISAIILPVLPNEPLADPPFDVLNPFSIWLLVVFISAINFLGYVFARLVGEQGIELSGLFGGLVSSTAVTLGFSERSKLEPQLARSFGVAIMISWTVMYARMLVLVAVLHRPLLASTWLPLLISASVGLAYCAFLIFRKGSIEDADIQLSNPLDIKSAIRFALLFTLILLASRAAQVYFGDIGLLVSAVVSGLANVNAITLSVAELTRNGSLAIEIASQALLFAIAANLVSKGSIVMIGGDRQLRRIVLPGLLMMLTTAIILALVF